MLIPSGREMGIRLRAKICKYPSWRKIFKFTTFEANGSVVQHPTDRSEIFRDFEKCCYIIRSRTKIRETWP